ncbi:MAG: hypothetical protein C4523_07680 [Myxococcales bacterium]|nr:MAG: hypothetical protein C4523_07680 [Myxococcales bacterium]
MTAVRIAVLGRDPLARALAGLAAGNGNEAALWPPAESGESVPARLRQTVDPADAARGAALIVLGEAGESLDATLEALGGVVEGDQVLLHVLARLLPGEDRPLRISERIAAKSCLKKLGVLAGPLAPADLADKRPAAASVASPFRETLRLARRIFETPRLRLFETDDLAGVELGAALSELFGAAIGVARELGLGAGPIAFVVARAVAEMARLGSLLGARPETFSGLSGLGRLAAFAADAEAPAVALGRRFARPGAVENDFAPTMETLRLAIGFARRRGVATPILFALDEIVAGRLSPEAAADRLLAADAGRETGLSGGNPPHRSGPLVNVRDAAKRSR